MSKNVSPENELVVARESEKALALVNDKTNTTDIQSLDQQVKSMMTFSENDGPKGQGKLRICKVCGKEGSMMNIMSHIEKNHITGISIPCELCGKLFKSRNGLSCRPGTRLFNNWRLIEYLKEATRSARLGTRSVLGAAGKVEI